MSTVDGKSVLEEIQGKVKAKWDLATGESAKDLYSDLYALTGEVIRIDQKAPAPGPLPIPDRDTNLQIENDKLKARIASTDALMNVQGDHLHRIAAILTSTDASQLKPEKITERALVVTLTVPETVEKALEVMTGILWASPK
jgi:hypothetical protein